MKKHDPKWDRTFLTYHPYMTYSDANNKVFVRSDGKRGRKIDEDTGELFRIGGEAYKRLPKTESKADFNLMFSFYPEFIQEWRLLLEGLHNEGILKPQMNGEDVNPDWEEVESHQILGIAWGIFTRSLETVGDVEKDRFRMAYACHALKEIDNVMITMDLGFGGAVIAAVEATNALSNVISIESGNEVLQKARRKLAYHAAVARHVETHAKRQQVIAYWQEYIYAGNPKLSNEKAAEWLKDTFPELSFRKLSEYVAQAKKEMKKIPPACKA